MLSKFTILQFLKFTLVGVSNALVSLAVYSLLVKLNIHYIIANVFAFLLSVLNSFFWNAKFVFKKQEYEKRNLWLSLFKTYISYGLTGLLLQTFLLFVFIDNCKVNKYIAQVLCIVINLPINFVLNKFWSFHRFHCQLLK